LTELTVVIVLAGLVTIGLVTFYFNSQATWIDGSTQAMTQREGTGLVEIMADTIRFATSAEVNNSPDPLHQQLILRDQYDVVIGQFVWNSSDSLIHYAFGPTAIDQGPLMTSKVTRFQLDKDNKLVYLRLLELRSANDQLVRTSSTMAMLNAPIP